MYRVPIRRTEELALSNEDSKRVVSRSSIFLVGDEAAARTGTFNATALVGAAQYVVVGNLFTFVHTSWRRFRTPLWQLRFQV